MPSSRHRVAHRRRRVRRAVRRPRRSVSDDRVEVTLVDRRNLHLFQPLLYQVATGALSPGDIAQPLRSILRKQRNTTVLLGEAVGIDLERREVLLADGGPIAYDTLDRRDRRPLLLLRPRRVGGDRARPQDARRRDRDPAADPDRVRGGRARARPERRRAEWMTFVLVGGGPTGVELAGALGEIARDTLRRDFRSIDTAAARILLVEAMDRILPTYPPDRSGVGAAPARAARGDRPDRTRGRRHRRRVGHASRSPAATEETIPARTVLWAAGVLAGAFVGDGRRRPTGAADRSRRPDPRRARPDRPGPPGDLRRRRRGRAAVEAGPARAGRRPGRDPGRPLRGAGDPRAASTASPSQPFRYSNHGDVAVIGRLVRRHRHPVARAVRAAERLHGLGAVARDPHRST